MQLKISGWKDENSKVNTDFELLWEGRAPNVGGFDEPGCQGPALIEKGF